MEPENFAAQINQLRANGWKCLWNVTSHSLPLSVQSRYPWLPPEYLDFISHLEICANQSDTGWILTPRDFDPQIEKASAHDEWERLSLEAADGDEEMCQAIRAFWDQHIPIHFDVSDGYSYHAIKLTDRSGQIVHGCEPEFEETRVVANSFSEFLAQL